MTRNRVWRQSLAPLVLGASARGKLNAGQFNHLWLADVVWINLGGSDRLDSVRIFGIFLS
ncbi:MAG: hypothetical protein EOO23_05990 [Comamonadaceae bacterium]|nr:MAG: hypothetical protein EOO23_05990 [Comamonadaceae bacterium]